MSRLHFSALKRISETPAHYLWHLDNRVDGPGMRLGRAVHAYALERRIPPVWGGQRRGRAWLEFEALYDNAEDILTASEWDTVVSVCAGINGDPLAAEWLEGEREQRHEWEWCGVPCAGRLDVWHAERGRLVDLKTTATVASFRGTARRLSYHAQLAWYRIALQSQGHDVHEVGCVVAPTKPPHYPAVYRLTELELEAGEKLCRTWIELWKQCSDANHWPAYGPEPMTLRLVDEWEM